MQNVRVRSSDGEEFSLTIEVAYRSKKIKAICMHQGLNEPVTLSEVNGLILEKAIRWMERYKDGSTFDVDDDEYKKGQFNEWDLEYLKIEREILFALSRAAFNMEVGGLVNFLAQAIVNSLKDKTMDQVRGFLGLPRSNPLAQRRHPAM